MSRFDSFFESPVNEQLEKQTLEKAKLELEKNRISARRKKWALFLAPALASVLGFVLFKWPQKSDPAFVAAEPPEKTNIENTENFALSELLDIEIDQETESADLLEVVSEIQLLEDLDYLESDEEWRDDDV